MRGLLAFLAYAAAFAVVAPAAFFAALFLAGPHGGWLSGNLQIVVLPLAWLAILVLPILAARAVWLRTGRPLVKPGVLRARE